MTKLTSDEWFWVVMFILFILGEALLRIIPKPRTKRAKQLEKMAEMSFAVYFDTEPVLGPMTIEDLYYVIKYGKDGELNILQQGNTSKPEMNNS